MRSVPRDGVIPFRVPVHGDLEVPAERGHVAGVGQPPDLPLLHGEVEPPHEVPELPPHLAELDPVLAVESFLRPVIFPHGERGLQPEPMEPEAVEEPLVVAEEGRGVAGALRGERDPLDEHDPAAGAAREGQETEYRLALPVEGEGEVADRLAPADDLAIVEDPVLPEEEEAVVVGKPEDLGGQRVQEHLRGDAVPEEFAPEGEHPVARRRPADEERGPFSALLDHRGVEVGAEEPVRRDQQVEPLDDVALRQGFTAPPGHPGAVFRHPSSVTGCGTPAAATPPDPPVACAGGEA
ncbi:MAG TPA: hypothetical protein DCP41_12330 [Deltaproteobacteria bacterium]|nr:hypothetical protein [Deltaproteobacteria bacterium]